MAGHAGLFSTASTCRASRTCWSRRAPRYRAGPVTADDFARMTATFDAGRHAERSRTGLGYRHQLSRTRGRVFPIGSSVTPAHRHVALVDPARAPTSSSCRAACIPMARRRDADRGRVATVCRRPPLVWALPIGRRALRFGWASDSVVGLGFSRAIGTGWPVWIRGHRANKRRLGRSPCSLASTCWHRDGCCRVEGHRVALVD